MSISHDDCKELLRLCVAKGVGLHHAVGMLCQHLAISLGDIASECGHSRNTLYNALKGLQNPSEKLRATVTTALGLDPWTATEDLLSKQRVWSPEVAAEIYSAHATLSVPPQYTFSLMLRLLGISKGDCAKALSCTPQKLNQYVSFSTEIDELARKELAHQVGFDHFTFADKVGISQPSRETLQSVFKVHHQLGISIADTTTLMGQWIGTTLSVIAQATHSNVAEVQKATTGKISAPRALRHFYVSTFNIDPWEQ